MDLFYRFFICKIVLKVFLSPIRSIISSSIIYGTTWTTVKIQLQKSTTCHAINNVGCMHIFTHPLRFLWYEKLRTFPLLQGSQKGLAHNTLTMYLTLYDLPYKEQLPVLDARGAIKITSCNLKMLGLTVPFHIGSFATLMLELCMS
jgi:hypothetical protein